MSTHVAAPQAATETPAVERRAAPRYPILQRCLVRPPGRAGAADWRCIAYNISATGVGITLPYAPPAGTVLEVEAWGAPAARPVLARVVRAAPAAFLWFCGCEFVTPLAPDELRAWLATRLDRLPGEPPDEPPGPADTLPLHGPP
jgi:hypothetical protein